MRLVDTQAFSRTPEGVDIGLRVAGPVPRMVAAMIDLGALVIGGILLSMAIAMLFGSFAEGFILIGWFFMFWLFPAFCEMYWGATVGKRAAGLKVIHDDGTPIIFSTAMTRNLLRFMDTVVVVLLIPENLSDGYADNGDMLAWGIAIIYLQPTSLLCILFHPLHKRPGDMVAGTLVVRSDKTPPPVFSGRVEPAEPPIPLRAEEQQAIIDFATRQHTISEARQAELASVLEDLTGLTGAPAVAALQSYARAFAGVEATAMSAKDDNETV